MADTIKQALDRRDLLKHIILPPHIDELLADLTSATPVPGGDDVTGAVTLSAKKTLGFLALDLTPPPTPVDYRLITDSAAHGFRFWLVLNSVAPACKLFEFAAGTAGVVLTPATYQASGDEERLVAAAGDVSIAGVAVALLIEGTAGQAATIRLSPTVGAPAGIVALQLVPPTVLIGSTGFGFELPATGGVPGAFVIDDSDTAVPPGTTIINGTTVATRADNPAWRGLAIRRARFYLPSGVPFLGGHAVDAFIEVGLAPGEGIDLAISTRVPPIADRPGIDVLIECRDPNAAGLQDFVPTLVEAAMELPLDGNSQPSPGGGFTMLAGKPVIARLRFARSVAEPETRITLAVESQGPDGVLAIVAPGGGPAARVLITAAALATAIVADKAPEGADTGGVVLHALLAVALGLSSCLKDKGRLTIHKVELSSTGHGLPVGDQVKFLVDYSVDVLVRPINVGVLSVQMRDEQPMRVRNRNVGLRINLSDPAASGVETVELDFSRADMEIEDPGAWKIDSPGSLFDILGTRSGRGSTWLEVDLRFKLNLGPVRVTGATIRATLTESGSIEATLRGLDASLEVPGVVAGGGALQLLEGGGFAAALDVNLVPLNLATDGQVVYKEQSGSFWLFVRIGVDLPGPIPIANTGLGIYGIAGAFGYNARPKPPGPTEPDPIGYQLRWDPSKPLESFMFSADNITVGAQAVLGTVPDLGFSFSTRAGLFITVPDIVVRGALWAKVLTPRMGVTDRPTEGGDPGLSFMGVVVVDPKDGVTVGVKGELKIPVILTLTVPLGAYFPTGQANSDNWYVYLGADGYRDASPPDGRALGPVRAEVLPDIVGAGADAYVMFRGRGIQRWPRGGPMTIADGLVLAFGFGFEYTLGVRPIAWAEVHASADILLATHPLTLAGFGTAGGSLNLGPFSIGVDAMISLLIAENADPFLYLRLCGHIDLFVTEIEGCVEMSINSEPELKVPPPDVHPLDNVVNNEIAGHLAYLIDDKYRRIGALATNRQDAAVVWPDTLLHLSFAVSPTLTPGYVAKVGGVSQFSPIDTYPTGVAAKPIGSDMLKYEWSLTGLALYDITDDPDGVGTLVNGPLSAAWQVGKDGDIGTRPQAGDLVLLTYQGDLFLSRLADGGKGLPHNPLHEAATGCQRRVEAGEGWAVGFVAQATGQSYLLPSDPLSPDPCVSRFTATLTEMMSDLQALALGPASAPLLPATYDYIAPRLETFTTALALERPFAGALDLSIVSGTMYGGGYLLKARASFQAANIVPSEPITAARLWVIVDGEFDPGHRPVEVRDDAQNAWAITALVPVDPGRMAVRFAPRGDGWIRYVDVRWFLGQRIAVVGLGGVTATAQAAASARNAAIQAEAARQAAAAAAQPQQETATTGEGVRCVLQPGRTYRLDVGMAWKGWIYRQDEDGSKHEAHHEPNGTTYRPKGVPEGGPFPSTARSYFFKTAPKARTALGGTGVADAPFTTLAVLGQPAYLNLLRVRRDLFRPEMLTRFVLGYTPSQSETARFCDDALNVHFSAGHVTTLAKVYGFTLKIGLRRVDVPGDEGDPVVLNGVWAALQKPQYLSGTDAIRDQVAVAAVCPMPRPGGTLSASVPLEREAWYEIYTLAQADDPANVLDGRLDGVTFRTSRWRNPTEMLAGLGFTPGPSPATGDLELRQWPALVPGAVDGSDSDFEDMLDAIGVDGWPAVQLPRVSVLWKQQPRESDPPWLCAGVLVESPEPIDRPGRVVIDGLRLVMPPSPENVFDVRRMDRTGARVLWLCSTPFVPHLWRRPFLFGQQRWIQPSITLTLEEVGGVLLTGSVRLPTAPSFAAEA